MKRCMKGSLIVLALTVAAGGCANKKKPENALTPPSQYPPMNQASLDVPATPATAPPASYTPPPQPVVYDAPVAAEQPVIEEPLADAGETYSPPARTTARRASSTSGTRYRVKKGDSLWSIAQTRYGNGNKWKAIAAANPTINPDRIQAGQTIVLP